MIDIHLSGEEFEDIYILSGITRGKGLIIQNKSHRNVIFSTAADRPVDSDTSGYLMDPYPTNPVYVDLYEFNLWAKGRGPLSVQEL